MTTEHAARSAAQQTLDALKDYIAEHNQSPTWPELAAKREITLATLRGHIFRLERQNRIHRVPGQRNLRLGRRSGGSLYFSRNYYLGGKP